MADSNIAGLPAGAAIADTDLIAGSDAGSGTLVKKTGLQFNTYIRQMLAALPTTDPHIVGSLWNNGGLVAISFPFVRSLSGATGAYTLTGQTADLVAGGPTFQVDFTSISVLPAEVLFSRTSQATLFDSTGALTYAPNNILRSSDLSVLFTPLNITVTTGISDPLGGSAAQTLTATANNGNVGISESAPAGNVIQSIWARRRTGSGTAILTAPDNNSTLTLSLTGSWTRFSIKSPSAFGSIVFFITLQTSGDQIDVYGAQAELVTYETIARTLNLTTSAVYYGPRLDYDPATLIARGLLIEESRTNLFLTSTTPSNQTITVSNATSYTVSFYGTGSLTLTGAVSHTVTGSSATVLTSYNFTSATTSLVIAVAGSVIYPNVEAGDFATSHIITAGAPVTRSADVVLLTGTATTALEGSAASAILEARLFATTPAGTEVLFGKSPTAYSFVRTATTLSFFSGGADLTATFGSGNISSAFRTAISFDGSTRNIVINGGTLVSGATVAAVTGDVPLGGFASGTQMATGWYGKMAIWNTRILDATLTSKSVVGTPF